MSRLKVLLFGIFCALSFTIGAQSSNDIVILDVKDYKFNKMVHAGITTTAREMDVLHVPIRWCRLIIRDHIRLHHFALNKGKKSVRKTVFRAVSFAYPSVSPLGDTIMLSGLVTIPVLKGNKPERMLIYHRILAPSYKIAPSNSIPIEAVLTADNTICVFPDYYGCGVTEGNPTPYTALNYHARCAADCALAALEIVKDEGIVLADGFYTWNTGYSQGGGYALATQRYIETELPDSLASLINLRWSLCGGGIYEPDKLFKNFIDKGDMGSTPSIYFQAVRGEFCIHQDILQDLKIEDLLSEKAIKLGIDSILNAPDDGFWDLAKKIDTMCNSDDPTSFFNPILSDTSSVLYKTLEEAFARDGCIADWHPRNPVCMYHSQNDSCIPYKYIVEAQNMLNGNDDNVVICNPPKNKAHFKTGFKYFYMLLRQDEQVLFEKLYLNSRQLQDQD